MEKLKKFLNRETILYLVFGVATTVVNYAVFHLLYNVVFDKENSLTANAVAFVAAVIFAFLVNKVFVFESKSWSMEVLLREVPAFLAARIGSFAFEEAGLLISEEVLHMNEVLIYGIDGVTIVKIALSVVVVILNYVLSKLFVFRK